MQKDVMVFGWWIGLDIGWMAGLASIFIVLALALVG